MACWSSLYSPTQSSETPSGSLICLATASLCLVDGALHVTASDTESYRNVAAKTLPINKRCALGGSDIPDLAERDIAAAGQGDLNLTYGVRALPVFGLPTHHEVETPVSFQHLCHRLTADSGLHGRGDIAYVEPITRANLPIWFDEQVRLPHRSIDCDVSDPAHSVDYLSSLVGNSLVKDEVRAIDLDGVDTLNSRQRLLDVVFDILRIAKTLPPGNLRLSRSSISSVSFCLVRPGRH